MGGGGGLTSMDTKSPRITASMSAVYPCMPVLCVVLCACCKVRALPALLTKKDANRCERCQRFQMRRSGRAGFVLGGRGHVFVVDEVDRGVGTEQGTHHLCRKKKRFHRVVSVCLKIPSFSTKCYLHHPNTVGAVLCAGWCVYAYMRMRV